MESKIYKVGLGRLGNSISLSIAILVGVCLTGCGGGFDAEGSIRSANATNAQRLSTLYSMYARQHASKGPKDEEAFRKFVTNFSPKLLERLDVDPTQVDGLFTSERDGEPLKIIYGLKCGEYEDAKPVVFEQTGSDGKRMVAFTDPSYEEVEDQSRYDELLKME